MSIYASIIESFGNPSTGAIQKFTPQELALIQKVVSGSMDYYKLSQELQTKLYDHFMPDMPYGVAKARSGDPDEWIVDHLEELL